MSILGLSMKKKKEEKKLEVKKSNFQLKLEELQRKKTGLIIE
jgi:hypothetical protein